ncbi:hypothetical protein L1049_005997 [Liquidambar formosana]|uniref:Uncharacterized protein n=1 Tax=Liquidambar formosana TaxID=63359 RepID=A0AAP0RF89_LIQFO
MKMKRDDAIDILKGCGFSAEIAITDLTNKSLVKIIENNSLWMHDQLRDMGRQIVQHENLEDPGMRSRLWDRDEVMTVLKNKKGTRNIQGIVLDFEKKHEVSSEKNHWTNLKRMPGFSSAMTYLKEIYKTRIHRGAEKDKNIMLRTKSFEPMVNLRLLQINHVKLAGNFKFIAATLKWLQWEGCLLKSLPSEFCPRDLAVLNLSGSKITRVWDWRWWNMYRNKMADKLLVMNLHDCWYLTDIPNLSGHRVLEKLILENCVRLVKVHKSVGDLTSLLYLNLKNCSNLVEFPTDVSGLKHLENLNLSGCLKLKELPEDMGSMKSLRELLVDDTAIVNLPDSIFRLKKLESLSLRNCRSLKQLPVCIGKLCSLRELYLDGSALEEIPDSVGSLTNLEKLGLVLCRSLTAIPDSVGNLKSLLELFLDSSSIKELPISIGSLSHLKFLSITRCRSLTKLPDSINGLASLVQFRLRGTSITEISDQVGALNMLEKLDMGNCKSLRSLPDSIGNMLNLTTLILDGAVITELPESIGELERLDTLRMDYCKHLRRLPASIGKLKNLRRLQMGETAVTELPEELGMLSSLTTLKMRKSHEHLTNIRENAELTNLMPQEKPKLAGLPMSFLSLSSLTELDARAWGISGKIPDDFEKLSLLETLDLGYNNISSLPSSLRGLSILQVLLLSHCKELKSLPPLPSSLLKLNVTNCTALENISDLSNLESLHELQLTNCRKIMDIPGLQCLRSLRTLYTSGCNACVPAIKRRLTKVALKHLSNLSVPGSEIPNWFVREIPSFSSRKNRDIKAVIIGVVVSFDQHSQDSFRDKASAIENVQAKIIRLDKPIFTTVLFSMEVPDTKEDQLYMCRCSKSRPIVFMLRDGDKIQVALRDDPNFKGFELKKYGIHLIFEDDDDIEEDDEEWLDESQQSVSYKLAKFFNSL